MLIAVTACVVIVGVLIAAYYLLFPSNVVIFTEISGGRKLVFSKSGIKINPAPDHYTANGFDHIEPYVSRLLEPSEAFKSLMIYSADSKRGFLLTRRNGALAAHFNLEWREEPEQEAALRNFFSALGISPSEDYLAQNGLVRDSTRILTYPINGDLSMVTALTKKILQDLYAILPTDGLKVDYSE